MLVLKNTDVIEVVLSGTADVHTHGDWVDIDETSQNPENPDYQNAIRTTAATHEVVATPASGKRRNVKGLSFKNEHASSSNTLTVQHNPGTGSTVVLWEGTLAAGELLKMDDRGVWFVYDVNGGVKMGATAATETLAGLIEIASAAEMEAATDVTRAVTPGLMHRHPGVCKFWAQVTGGGTPALTTNYNVTSIADTGTGRMTVTIATDFSSANWAASVTTFTTATSGDEGIPNINAKAAGTIEAGNRIITPAAADPNVGYDVFGFGDQ